jgi:hypothetical protein
MGINFYLLIKHYFLTLWLEKLQEKNQSSFAAKLNKTVEN